MRWGWSDAGCAHRCLARRFAPQGAAHTCRHGHLRRGARVRSTRSASLARRRRPGLAAHVRVDQPARGGIRRGALLFFLDDADSNGHSGPVARADHGNLDDRVFGVGAAGCALDRQGRSSVGRCERHGAFGFHLRGRGGAGSGFGGSEGAARFRYSARALGRDRVAAPHDCPDD